MNIKNVTLAAASLAAATCAYSVTGFGSSEFTLEPGSSNLATSSSTSTAFSFTGDGASFIVGFITPEFSLPPQFAQLELNATVFNYTAPATTFFIDLYDADFDFITYQGNWSGFTASAPLSFLADYTGATNTGGGTFQGNIVAVGVRLGSTGGAASIGLNDLKVVTSVIPEPSSFAALAGLVAVGFAASRRRRA